MLQSRLGKRTKTSQTRAVAFYLPLYRAVIIPKMIDGISLRFRFDRPFERPFRNQFSELAPRPPHSVQKIPSNGMQNLPIQNILAVSSEFRCALVSRVYQGLPIFPTTRLNFGCFRIEKRKKKKKKKKKKKTEFSTSVEKITLFIDRNTGSCNTAARLSFPCWSWFRPHDGRLVLPVLMQCFGPNANVLTNVLWLDMAPSHLHQPKNM